MNIPIELPKISPFVVGIWCGESKPILDEYIERFVEEMTSILNNGIAINGHRVNIRFGLIICDTPARSLMKGLNSFS